MPILAQNIKPELDKVAKKIALRALSYMTQSRGWGKEDTTEACHNEAKTWARSQIMGLTENAQIEVSEYLYDKVEYIFNTLRTVVLTQDF